MSVVLENRLHKMFRALDFVKLSNWNGRSDRFQASADGTMQVLNTNSQLVVLQVLLHVFRALGN